MEIEAKYRLESEEEGRALLASPLVAACRAGEEREILMESTYYFDAAGALASGGFSLRFRRENGLGVCCLKQRTGRDRGAVRERLELECEADTVGDGVEALMLSGAPEEFCRAVRGAELIPAAHVRFLRRAQPVAWRGMAAELDFDCGAFGSGGEEPFCELELELKSGPEGDFLEFLRILEERFSLRPQPLSKLARALHAEENTKDRNR